MALVLADFISLKHETRVLNKQSLLTKTTRQFFINPTSTNLILANSSRQFLVLEDVVSETNCLEII